MAQSNAHRGGFSFCIMNQTRRLAKMSSDFAKFSSVQNRRPLFYDRLQMFVYLLREYRRFIYIRWELSLTSLRFGKKLRCLIKRNLWSKFLFTFCYWPFDVSPSEMVTNTAFLSDINGSKADLALGLAIAVENNVVPSFYITYNAT